MEGNSVFDNRIFKFDKTDRFDFIDGCLELHVELDEVETQRQGWDRCQIGGELKGDDINFEDASNFLFFKKSSFAF